MVTAAAGFRASLGSARSWSLLAVAAGVLAAIPDGLLIASQSDLGSLVWPLILLPVVLVPVPLIVPTRWIRIAAAVGMAGWCFLTAFSLGPAFLPCLACLAIAAARPVQETL